MKNMFEICNEFARIFYGRRIRDATLFIAQSYRLSLLFQIIANLLHMLYHISFIIFILKRWHLIFYLITIESILFQNISAFLRYLQAVQGSIVSLVSCCAVLFIVGDKLLFRQTSRRETERRELHGDRYTSRAPTCASALPHRRSRRYEHLSDGILKRAQTARRFAYRNYSTVVYSLMQY